MREEMAIIYGKLGRKWPHVRFYFWEGKPYEVDDLGRVSAASARHIIVLGGSEQPRIADSLVITTLCALQCLPECLDDSRSRPNVVVEVTMPQNVRVARQLGSPMTRTVTAKQAIDELEV